MSIAPEIIEAERLIYERYYREALSERLAEIDAPPVMGATPVPETPPKQIEASYGVRSDRLVLFRSWWIHKMREIGKYAADAATGEYGYYKPSEALRIVPCVPRRSADAPTAEAIDAAYGKLRERGATTCSTTHVAVTDDTHCVYAIGFMGAVGPITYKRTGTESLLFLGERGEELVFGSVHTFMPTHVNTAMVVAIDGEVSR